MKTIDIIREKLIGKVVSTTNTDGKSISGKVERVNIAYDYFSGWTGLRIYFTGSVIEEEIELSVEIEIFDDSP